MRRNYRTDTSETFQRNPLLQKGAPPKFHQNPNELFYFVFLDQFSGHTEEFHMLISLTCLLPPLFFFQIIPPLYLFLSNFKSHTLNIPFSSLLKLYLCDSLQNLLVTTKVFISLEIHTLRIHSNVEF